MSVEAAFKELCEQFYITTDGEISFSWHDDTTLEYVGVSKETLDEMRKHIKERK